MHNNCEIGATCHDSLKWSKRRKLLGGYSFILKTPHLNVGGQPRWVWQYLPIPPISFSENNLLITETELHNSVSQKVHNKCKQNAWAFQTNGLS